MQQINLYLPEFQPNREPLRSMQMLWGLGLFIVLLLVVSLFSANANHERELALVDSRAQLEQLKIQIVQLEQQHPNVNLADLDAQILQISSELERREQILSIIVNKNLGNSTGFSGYLQALGRQSLDTVSLSAFSLAFGGTYVELLGRTQSADQIPLYIQRLRTEPVFAQSAFGVLNVEPVKNMPGVFDFSLAKAVEERIDNPETKTAVQMLLDLKKNKGGEN